MSGLQSRPARSEYRVLRGLRHRLLWWGERTENPVLLLHGWGDSSETWQFLVDCLPEDWSFVALDWRGFGGTEWPQQGYYFPDYFGDLDALLDTLSPDAPVRAIAHSMGGNIATMYAGIRPQRFEWIVNLEGIGLAPTKPEMAPDRYIEWLDGLRTPPRERRYTSLDTLVDFLVARNPDMSRDRAELLARAWTTADAEGGWKLAFDPRHRNINPVLFQRGEAEACWRRCTAPVLLILGKHSDIRARVHPEHRSNEYFHSMFRNLRIELLADVGHMMHIEDPQTIARCVREFAQAPPARRLLPEA